MATQHDPAAALERRLDAARAEVERRVRAGIPGGVERLREEFEDVWSDPEAALELIYAEFVALREHGRPADPADWYRRFPERRERLERLFGLYELLREPDGVPRPTGDTLPDSGPSRPAADLRDQPAGYTLADEIGRGGSAVVYRAVQHSLNREVALKLIRGSPWLGDGESLRREAELAGRLQHPNIVQVFEVGEWNGMPFIAMELVPGRGLHAVLDDARRRGTASMTAERAAGLVETLARAMSSAHDRGVVHRDLKPANVLVAPGPAGESVKIVDFGLAVVCDTAESVTRTLSVSGTPCYMAPEQAEGRVGDIGPRSDIYALGAILYELLTARPPFQGATVLETLDMVRANDPLPPRALRPRLPRDLETICLKCLRKSPDRRYESAGALADDLRRFLEGRPIVARPVSAWERAAKWVRRRPAVATLSLALAAAVAAGAYQQVDSARARARARENELELNRELQASLAGRLVASARALWNNGQVREARQFLADCPETLRDPQWADLHRLCHAEIANRAGVDIVGDTLAVSADGTRLAVHSAGPPRQVRVIDAADARPIASIDTSLALHSIRFTAGDRELIVVRRPRPVAPANGGPAGPPIDALRGALSRAGDANAEVVVWDGIAKQPGHRWTIANPTAIAVSGDGRRLAARAGRRLRVWDSVSGDPLAELPELPDAATRVSLAWNHAGTVLAVRLPTEIRVFDVATGRPTGTIAVDALDLSRWEAAMPAVRSFADPVFLTPDGTVALGSQAKSVATTGAGLPTARTLVAWNLTDGAERYRLTVKGASPRVEFSPDGRRLALVANQDIELHDAATGDHLATLRGHTANVLAVQFSPDGGRLHSVAGDKTLRTWDISPWRPAP